MTRGQHAPRFLVPHEGVPVAEHFARKVGGVQNDNGPLGCEMDLCFRIIVTVQKPTFRGCFTHLKNVVLGLVVIITSFMSPTWTFIFRGYNYPPLRILGMSGLGCQVSHLF